MRGRPPTVNKGGPACAGAGPERSFPSGLSSGIVRAACAVGVRAGGPHVRSPRGLAWALGLMDSRWTAPQTGWGAAGVVETPARGGPARTAPVQLRSSPPARLDGPGRPERGPAKCRRRGVVCSPHVRRSRPSLWEDGAGPSGGGEGCAHLPWCCPPGTRWLGTANQNVGARPRHRRCWLFLNDFG